MAEKRIHITINKMEKDVTIDTGMRLIDMLRDVLGLTGTKEGCGIGECGACTVLFNGQAVNSCLVLAAAADGHEILTVEGIYQDGRLSRVQDAFVRHNAIQCGFCIPGLVMSATALLQEHPNPTRTEIKTAIAGNLCRCTGYQQIIEAIEDAAGQGVRDAEPGI